MKTRQNITSIIYDKHNNILSIGKNSYIKTHPLQAKHAQLQGEPHKIYLHSEIHAITRCKQPEKMHRILIIRENSLGEYLPSKPCKICMSCIQQTSIKIIEYT